MSADEPFVGACDTEPCNDNGERLIAEMKMDEMIGDVPHARVLEANILLFKVFQRKKTSTCCNTTNSTNKGLVTNKS